MANLHKDFRSGNLNEDYGYFLLKQIGAVAPVPRPEDYGIDAFVTLLTEQGDLYRAADTILVQLKSPSTKIVDFGWNSKKGNKELGEVDWLRNLDVPLFFGWVAKVEERGGVKVPGRLRLYSGAKLYEWLADHEGASAVRVTYEKDKAYETGTDWEERSASVSQKYDQEVKNARGQHDPAELKARLESSFREEHARPSVVWLGEPIVEIDQVEVQDAAARAKTVETIAAWAKVLNEMRHRRPLGINVTTTGGALEKPERSGYVMGASPSDDAASTLLYRETALIFARFLIDQLGRGREEDIDALIPVFRILQRLYPSFSLSEQSVQEWRQQLRHVRQSFNREDR